MSTVEVATLDPGVVDRIGGRSIGFQVHRTDGAGATAPVTVRVDTASIADTVGGGFAARLRVVRYPACALTTPDGPGCATPTPVASSADPVRHQVTAVVDAEPASVAAGGAVYALAAASTGGDAGNFSATPLKASDGWVVGEQSGSFSYSYPLPAAPSTGGDTPALALAYDSGSVDGLTSHENNQSSPVGLGWNLPVPFIEHRMAPCTSSDLVGNLCWGGRSFVLSMDGHSAPLNYQSTSGDRDQYQMQDDQGWRIEQVYAAAGNPNGDNGGVYWKVTTTDGTKYYFGRENSEWSSAPNNSTLNVTMYAQQAGDVCWDTDSHRCDIAWRWNLAYVVDPVGNLQAYQWEKGRASYQNPGHGVKHYDAAGYLTRISYGLTTANARTAAAPQRIDLAYGWRCDFAGCRAPVPHDNYAANYPDVPFDLWCPEDATSCSSPTGPVFFYLKRLESVTATVFNGTGYTPVERVALEHGWPQYQSQSGSAVMWLRTLTRTGYAPDGTGMSLPPVSFTGDYEPWLPNRWDRSQVGTYQNKPRITDVVTETGGRTHVTYGQPNDCGAQTLDGNEDRQTTDCYPSLEPNGHQAWFRRWLVTRLDVIDRYGAPTQTTSYEYDTETGAAWHSDNDPIGPKDQQRWSDYRGYYKITVRSGAPGGTVTTTKQRFFRGMDGDHLRDGSTRTATVKTADQPHATGNLVYPDTWYLKGLPLEERTLHADGTEVTAQQHEYTARVVDRGPAGPWSLFQNGVVQVGESLTRDLVSAGGVLRRYQHTVRHGYDQTYGLPIWTQDDGDPVAGSGPSCAYTTYARNTDAWIVDTEARVVTATGACPADGSAPVANLTGRTDTYYDAAFTTLAAAPTAGLATRVVAWASDAGTADQATQVTASKYDGYGRVVATVAPDNAVTGATSFDTAGPATTTAYTQPHGPVTGVSTTNPAGHTTSQILDPGRGTPLSDTDANGSTTTRGYDPLGRLTTVRLPGDGFDARTFGYTVSDTVPSTIVATEIPAAGAQPIRTWTFLDSLGRTFQSQTASPTGTIATTGVRFDERGNTAVEVATFDGTGTPGTVYGQWYDKAFTDTLPAQTVHSFDDRNRDTAVSLVSLGATVRTATTSYDGTTTTTTPPANTGASAVDVAPTTVTTDLGGHVLTRTQGEQTTTRAYDTTGRLVKVTSPGGAVTSYGYDWLGRRTTSTDPDAGVTRSDYYPSGAVRHSRDANGTDRFTAIDVLSRPVATYAGTSSAGALLTRTEYDGTPLGATTQLKGSVTARTSYDGSTPGAPGTPYAEAYGYDAQGRVVRTDQVVPAALGAALAGTYTSTVSYDGLGRPTASTYPAAGGLPAETVTSGWNGAWATTLTSPLATYVSATTYTGTGRVAGLTLGVDGATGSVRRAYTWDRATGNLLTQAATTPSTSSTATLQSDSYSYAPTDTITKINDAVAGQQQCFGYDQLDRLVAAGTSASGSAAGTACAFDSTGPDPYRESYAYDGDGNLTTLVHNGATTTFGYGTDARWGSTGGPHAPTSRTVGGATVRYSYDPAGRLTSRSTDSAVTTYTWDARGRLVTAGTGGAAAGFVDGPGDRRWVRRTATETVVYLTGQELHLATGATEATAVRSYQHQDQTVAVRRTGAQPGLYWTLADRQGTVSLTVDATTAAVTRSRALPYGGDRAASRVAGPTDRGWLGQVRDADTGLNYLNARYYDPELAHFVSVDPLDDQSSPQHANPYGYAADNPVTHSDPSGLTTYYTVVRGDNWNTVSAKSGLTLNQLRALNGGSLMALKAGQKVNVTRSTTSKATSAAAKPKATSTAAKPTSAAAKPKTTGAAVKPPAVVPAAAARGDDTWACRTYGACGKAPVDRTCMYDTCNPNAKAQQPIQMISFCGTGTLYLGFVNYSLAGCVAVDRKGVGVYGTGQVGEGPGAGVSGSGGVALSTQGMEAQGGAGSGVDVGGFFGGKADASITKGAGPNGAVTLQGNVGGGPGIGLGGIIWSQTLVHRLFSW